MMGDWVYCGHSRPRTAVTKCRCLKTTEMYYFSVLENRCMQLRCQQGHIPSGASKQSPSLPLSAPGGPGCSLGCKSITPVYASVFIWPSPGCLCVSFPLLIRTSIIAVGSPLMQYDLILTWSHLQRLCFQKDHIRRFSVDMHFRGILFNAPHSDMGHSLIVISYLSAQSYLWY